MAMKKMVGRNILLWSLLVSVYWTPIVCNITHVNEDIIDLAIGVRFQREHGNVTPNISFGDNMKMVLKEFVPRLHVGPNLTKMGIVECGYKESIFQTVLSFQQGTSEQAVNGAIDQLKHNASNPYVVGLAQAALNIYGSIITQETRPALFLFFVTWEDLKKGLADFYNASFHAKNASDLLIMLTSTGPNRVKVFGYDMHGERLIETETDRMEEMALGMVQLVKGLLANCKYTQRESVCQWKMRDQ